MAIFQNMDCEEFPSFKIGEVVLGKVFEKEFVNTWRINEISESLAM